MASPRQKIRIAHVTTVPDSLWAFFGGQIGFLKSRGYEVHAVSSPGELLERFADRERIPIHAIEMTRGISPARDLLSVARLVRHFRRLRPHIVHAHTPKAGLLTMLAARAAHVPVRIYHLHGLRWETSGGIRRLVLVQSDRIAGRLAHQVLCVGPSLRSAALAAHIAPHEKLKVLASGSINGVDGVGRFDPRAYNEASREQVRRQWGIPPEALVLGFVGRLVRDKGVEDLLTSWKVLRDQFSRLHLLIVGPLEPGDPISAIARETLSADPRIHAAGEQWDTPPLYAAMDLFVLPTHREGFPVTPLEAAAMGLPVVGTTAVGCADAVRDGVTGILVPPKDPAALREAVAAYLADPARRQRDGQAGRDWVLQAFQPKRIWEELDRVYARLLQDRGVLPLPVYPAPEGAEC